RSKKATPSAVGVAHYAPLGAAGIMALIGPFCKPHVQRGVMILPILRGYCPRTGRARRKLVYENINFEDEIEN
ncbi:hypothetical protein, partial [Fournierella sp.]|uniref:hypothetical protein n=1 Tax=Allofournierella sp. TaxID=1940256 RepID=UPI0025BEE417